MINILRAGKGSDYLHNQSVIAINVNLRFLIHHPRAATRHYVVILVQHGKISSSINLLLLLCEGHHFILSIPQGHFGLYYHITESKLIPRDRRHASLHFKHLLRVPSNRLLFVWNVRKIGLLWLLLWRVHIDYGLVKNMHFLLTGIKLSYVHQL